MKKFQLTWAEHHAALFSALVETMNIRGIRYFILRNYEQLPQKNPSKDIDIVIEPGSYKIVSKILETLYQEYGFHYVSLLRFERVHCWYGASISRHESIHIDLIENYLHKGIEIFPFNLLYQHTHDYKNFRVLDNDYDTVMLLYYKLFAAKKLIPRYRERITIGYQADKNINQIIQKTSGRKYGNKIIQLLQDKNYDELEFLTTKISQATKIRAFCRIPLRTIKRFCAFCLGKFYHIVICPHKVRKFIAILGPDGVGKSTFIDQLVNHIEFYYVADDDKCCIYHHRPGWLPNLGALGERAKVMKEDKDFFQPHRGKPANSFSSFARMSYYWLDYVIGIPLILRRNAKWDFFAIYDRYIYDFLIDPYRSRIKLPYWLRSLFATMVPQPPLVFMLLTDTETIYNRKQELTKEEIERQLAEYRKLSKKSSRFVILDASQTPEQIAEQAMEIILQRFATMQLGPIKPH